MEEDDTGGAGGATDPDRRTDVSHTTEGADRAAHPAEYFDDEKGAMGTVD